MPNPLGMLYIFCLLSPLLYLFTSPSVASEPLSTEAAMEAVALPEGDVVAEVNGQKI